MCKKCGDWKPLTDFYVDKNGKYGRRAKCKKCDIRNTTKYYQSAKGKAARWRSHTKDETRFKKLVYTAEKKGVPCSLTFEEYKEITSKPCVYCGSPLPPTGHGLDQKEPGVGYSTTNAVPCCRECNSAKNKWFTYDEMLVIGRGIRQVWEDRDVEMLRSDAVASGLVGPLLCPGTRDLHERCRGNRHLLSGGWHVLWPDLDPD